MTKSAEIDLRRANNLAEAKRDIASRLTVAAPKRFQGLTLETFPGNKDQVEIALNAIMAGKGLFLSGPCGCGKTGLALSLAWKWKLEHLRFDFSWDSEMKDYCGKAMLQEPPKTKFMPAVEFFLELKDSMDTNRPSGEILDAYSFGFLIIDDMGAEKVSDWSRQMFYTLIDRRYRDMQQTIITSNLSLGELAQAIDERIASRIGEMCEVIYLEKLDFRMRGVGK